MAGSSNNNSGLVQGNQSDQDHDARFKRSLQLLELNQEHQRQPMRARYDAAWQRIRDRASAS